jgi:uncharacterized protein (DUF2336 family)
MQPDLTAAPRQTDVAGLLDLAASRTGDDRARLMMGVVALCRAQPPGAAAEPVLGDIFLKLVRDAEMNIRQVLAENLADAAWVPRALLDLLMLDEIEIARPLIARSPLMRDEDLLRVLIEATIEHQIEVARRPRLSARVADAVIDTGEPAPLTALAGNETAEISEGGLQRLIEEARRVAALRVPLSRHPRLNRRLAQTLFNLVGDALKEDLQSRFAEAGPMLAPAITAAIENAIDRPRPAMTVLLAPSGAGGGDRDEMDRRLVDKLARSGQLRPGFLIRAAREKQLGLFEHALATLSGHPLSQIRDAVRRSSAHALYLACAGVGIDRAVFPTLLGEVRRLTGGLPGADSPPDLSGRTLTPMEAGYGFRMLMETNAAGPVA